MVSLSQFILEILQIILGRSNKDNTNWSINLNLVKFYCFVIGVWTNNTLKGG